MYNRDKIMRKLLGKPTVESSHDTPVGVTSSPLPAAYRPSAAQNVLYNAGVPIACLAKSPDGRSVVLAGRHILKVVKLEGLTAKEGIDLRATITSQPSSKINSTADQLSIKDVNWPSGHGDTTIFTACANGKIFQYDLARMGGSDSGPMEVVQMREDSRQVNTLDVNPHRGTYLLSGSQDGIVRCFDIRTPQRSQLGFLTYRPVQAFKCNEGVRHVKWSPKDGFYFACGTEQGIVLKWDIRKATAPTQRINAHDKACASIAWHPDGEHLISGGIDNKCFVWDVSSKAEKRQKAKWAINTPAPIASVAWRPGTWSATAQGKRTAQVAVTYDDSSQMRHGINACHVWDLARPTMPFKELQNFDAPPAALLWHDQDLLWTAGHDGLFNQFDIAFAPKVMDRTSVSTMAFSSQGDVLMFLDERPPARRVRPPITPSEVLSHGSHGSYSSSPTTPMLSISRSDSEDEVVGSFLRSRGKGRRKRTPSGRSAHTLSTTPPGGPEDHHILALEQSLKVTGFYKSQQGMAIGPVPSASKVNIYHYLSVHYLETLYELLPSYKNAPLLGDRINMIIEHYARAAENVSLFRLAQTWRIVAYAMNLFLSRRAQYHLDRRTGRLQHLAVEHRLRERSALRSSIGNPTVVLPIPSSHETATPRKALSSSSLDKSATLKSLLSEEFESTSNVPTPIARPVDDGGSADHDALHHRYGSDRKLTPVIEKDSFSLPPALHSLSFQSRQRLDSEPLSVTSHDSENTHASTEGYDFYDIPTMTHAIDVPATKKKEQNPADYVEPRSPHNRRQSALRQDSDESFAQLFSISSGSRQSTGLTGSSDSSTTPMRRYRLPAITRQYSDTGSDSTGGEYGSRIRGRHIDDSPEFRRLIALRKPLERTDSNLTDDYPMPTQTTSDSLGSQDVVHPKPDVYPKETPSDAGHREAHGSDHHGSDRGSPEHSEQIAVEVITDRDYLPLSDDAPYPYTLASEFPAKPSDTPLDPYTLITRALQFEVKSSALNASAMILLLKPLLPNDLIDKFQATAILKQHHSRLMGMKLFTEAALLRKVCVKGWPGEPLHDWGDNFQSIFMPAQQNVSAKFFCPKCRKPREVDPKSKGGVWRCERCREVMGPCAICGHRDVTENMLPEEPLSLELVLGEMTKPESSERKMHPESILSTWWFCAGCGHGGHSTCMHGWHSSFADAAASGLDELGHMPDAEGEFSDGCCPMDGCGHACLPGKWRAETAVATTEEVSRAVREVTRGKSTTSSPKLHGEDGRRRGGLVGSAGSDVFGDVHEVAQSKAVASVRETLATGGSPRLPSGGVLSSSPGRTTGNERERRKSVKFAGTEERR